MQCTYVLRKVHIPSLFQLLLELKNVSSSSRQLRITPPSTKYFSIGLGKSTNQTSSTQEIILSAESVQHSFRGMLSCGHGAITFLVSPVPKFFIMALYALPSCSHSDPSLISMSSQG